MTIDPEALQAATAAVNAVIDAHALGDTPDAERLARAALESMPEAILEDAPLVVTTLNRLSDDEAEFTFPGGLRLVLNKGDWVERGRPARLHLSILDLGAITG
ncbi:hypothetical protein SEA_GINGERBUG_30 [Microbacterium phage Gingerbug]|nr:hypothetical protein SEA_GINGERBUG_30 [Microbacterium phage Gingerbug]